MVRSILQNDERTSIALRELYSEYGYRQYKVNQFEEYDLYMQNKNFLSSEQILTFSDTNGKLMALKPDVTISIIKNTEDDGSTKKLCYNEFVCRVPKGAYGFREIMQTGLECIGKADAYSVCEVIMLAAKSLALISEDYILDLSDTGVISGILNEFSPEPDKSAAILAAFRDKSIHGLRAACEAAGLPADTELLLEQISRLYAPLPDAIRTLKTYDLPEKSRQAVDFLSDMSDALTAFGNFRINLDFSVVNDMDYYNGVIFKGFISGIAESVLSGGRYDGLMAKMGKSGEAIGFAVYLDVLERFNEKVPVYDTDTLIVYEKGTPIGEIVAAVKKASENGSVRVCRDNADNISCRYRVNLSGSRLKG